MTSPIEECDTCVGMPTTGPDAPAKENGLFQAVTVTRTATGDHWPLVGWQWESQYCAPGWSWTRPCSQLAVPRDKLAEANGLFFSNAVPWTAGVSVGCQPDGDTDYAQRAATRFDEQIEQLIESTLWADRWGNGGVVPKDGTVQAASATPLVAMDPLDGLALLEEKLAGAYSRSGVIHAPRRAMNLYASMLQIERRAGRPYTPTGNRWAFGTGYASLDADPLGLGAAAAGQTWLIATGAVGVWIGPTIARSAFDHLKNIDLSVVEAPVAAGYDCAAFAVLVNLVCPATPAQALAARSTAA